MYVLCLLALDCMPVPHQVSDCMSRVCLPCSETPPPPSLSHDLVPSDPSKALQPLCPLAGKPTGLWSSLQQLPHPPSPASSLPSISPSWPEPFTAPCSLHVSGRGLRPVCREQGLCQVGQGLMVLQCHCAYSEEGQ